MTIGDKYPKLKEIAKELSIQEVPEFIKVTEYTRLTAALVIALRYVPERISGQGESVINPDFEKILKLVS